VNQMNYVKYSAYVPQNKLLMELAADREYNDG